MNQFFFAGRDIPSHSYMTMSDFTDIQIKRTSQSPHSPELTLQTMQNDITLNTITYDALNYYLSQNVKDLPKFASCVADINGEELRSVILKYPFVGIARYTEETNELGITTEMDVSGLTSEAVYSSARFITGDSTPEEFIRGMTCAKRTEVQCVFDIIFRATQDFLSIPFRIFRGKKFFETIVAQHNYSIVYSVLFNKCAEVYPKRLLSLISRYRIPTNVRLVDKSASFLFTVHKEIYNTPRYYQLLVTNPVLVYRSSLRGDPNLIHGIIAASIWLHDLSTLLICYGISSLTHGLFEFIAPYFKALRNQADLDFYHAIDRARVTSNFSEVYEFADNNNAPATLTDALRELSTDSSFM